MGNEYPKIANMPVGAAFLVGDMVDRNGCRDDLDSPVFCPHIGKQCVGDSCAFFSEEGRGCGLAQEIRAKAIIANVMVKQAAKDADDPETFFELQSLPTYWPTTYKNGEIPPWVNVAGEWDEEAGQQKHGAETGPIAGEREVGGSIECGAEPEVDPVHGGVDV